MALRQGNRAAGRRGSRGAEREKRKPLVRVGRGFAAAPRDRVGRSQVATLLVSYGHKERAMASVGVRELRDTIDVVGGPLLDEDE
jgi:hypothetical protein